MPSCQSRYFGRIEWEAPGEVIFPCGLPGFEREKRFLAVVRPDLEPLVFLQGVDNPDLCFLTLPVRVVDGSYEPAISPDDLRALRFAEERQPAIGSDVLCLAILSLSETEGPAANLLAPLVINLGSRVAVQAIRTDERYSCREPLPACEVQTCS